MFNLKRSNLKLKWFSYIVVIILFLDNICFAAEKALPLPESFAAYLKSLEAASDLRSAELLKSCRSLISKIENFQPRPLDAILSESAIPVDQLNIMSWRSKGLFGLDTILAKKKSIEKGFSLGLSARNSQYELFSEVLGLIPWTEAYADLKIDWHKVKNHTAIFLNLITDSKKNKYPVVFFVPTNSFHYQGKSITGDELKWLLKNPDRLQNTYFVFGAYDLVDVEMERLRAECDIVSANGLTALLLRRFGIYPNSYDEEL